MNNLRNNKIPAINHFDGWDFLIYALQLCTQKALAMAVRTVMTKLMMFLSFSFFMTLIV